jgi:spore coat-associated protein N
MRTLATLGISLVMALAAIGLAVAAPGRGDDPASASVQSASGAVSIGNSREGDAVFAASAMRPGEGVSGTVTIGNDGDVTGRFAVGALGVQDVAGPNGGRLSERVQLVLFDVTDVHNPMTVFAGHPADFDEVDVGTLGPGAERDYLFAATLPEGGASDNLYQGASLSLGFQWRAGAVASSIPTPTATPTPTPTATPVVTPTPTPPAVIPTLGLPPTTSCVSRGKIKLKLKAPAGLTIVSATVTVNGKVNARLKGAKAGKPVSLRGLPKKSKVKVTLRASDGKTYSATRTYRACARR